MIRALEHILAASSLSHSFFLCYSTVFSLLYLLYIVLLVVCFVDYFSCENKSFFKIKHKKNVQLFFCSSDITSYIPSGEWHLDDVIIRYHNKTYGGNVPFSDVTFWLVIRRKTLYYVFNLIVPCACVMVLSFLVFYLPPESGEKVSLSVT